MAQSKKQRIAAVCLAVLGVAMLVIGGVAMLAPPAITGVGFLVVAWALW